MGLRSAALHLSRKKMWFWAFLIAITWRGGGRHGVLDKQHFLVLKILSLFPISPWMYTEKILAFWNAKRRLHYNGVKISLETYLFKGPKSTQDFRWKIEGLLRQGSQSVPLAKMDIILRKLTLDGHWGGEAQVCWQSVIQKDIRTSCKDHSVLNDTWVFQSRRRI